MRRVARGLGIGALAVLALMALLVGTTLTALRTSWGGDLARRLGLSAVNNAIAGSVQIGAFSFAGDRLSLTDVVVREPNGQVVVRVRAIDVAFSPLSLLHQHVRIPRIKVVAPSLWLSQDPAGLNLSRALAPRVPSPKQAAPNRADHSTNAGGMIVDVANLHVIDGALAFQTADDGPPRRRVQVASLNIAAAVHYEAGPSAFALSMRVDAMVKDPRPARFSLRVTGSGLGDRRAIDVQASLGASTLAAGARTDSATRGLLTLSRLHVTPEMVRAFLPDLALLVPVDVTAHVARDASIVTIDADVSTAAGDLNAHGTVDTGAARIQPFLLNATHVNLGRILAGLPPSNLSFTAAGDVSRQDARTLSGALVFDMPPGQVNGARVGPVVVRATASGGQFDVAELRAALPGITIVAHGPVGPDRFGLDVAVDAPDLALTSRTLSSFRGLSLPPLAGRGKIDLSLRGSSRQPAVRLNARFPSLAFGADSVTGLTVDARVPDARIPQTGVAELHLTRARIGDRTLGASTVRLRSRARRLEADVQIGGSTPLSLAAAGTWGQDAQSFELDRFRMSYPEGDWAMAGSASLSWRAEHRALTGLDLRSGRQRIRLELSERGRNLQAKVNLQRINLGRLPKLILPANLAVGGQLDLEGNLKANSKNGFAAPSARVNLSLRDGRLGNYRDLAVELEGQYRAGRAAGHLKTRGFGTGADASFDVPTVWPLAESSGPLTLDLTMPETDLTALLTAAQSPLRQRIAGRVGIVLHLRGSAKAPVLGLVASARGLVVDGQSLGDLTLKVNGDAGAPVSVALTVGASGASRPAATGALNVRTDLSLATLIRRPPTTAEIMRTPFDVDGHFEDVSLRTLAHLAQSTEVSGGTASLRLSASGTARAPTGALNVQVAGAVGPRFPSTDARIDAAFGEQDTRVALRVLRKERALFSASAILGLAGRRLTDVAGVSAAPLSVRAALGPLHLSRDGVPGSPQPAGSDTLSAELRAILSIDGTLGHPDMTVNADVTEGRIGTRPIGDAHVHLTYKERQADAEVLIRSAVKGELRLTSHSKIDLGYPQVARGVDLDSLGLDARLTAEQFDLSLLSGVTEDVRQVGGALSASITAQGTVRAPRVRGQVEWTNGALTLLGLGDYRKLHLKAHGDENALWLDELGLASGDGNARVTAHAVRGADRRYDLDANAAFRRFPIYGQGQVLATVSIDGSAKGQVSPEGLQAAVRISEAQIELTDAKQKKLPSLARPADVILMEGSKAVDQGEGRKLAALAEALGGGRRRVESTSPGMVAPPDPRPAFQTHLAIDAPRNLWVRGKDAAVELGLGPDFRVDVNGPPKIYGQVVIRRGRIDVLGRRFDLQAGSTLRFIGQPDSPWLDVTARYSNETEHIAVILKATGTVDKMTVVVSSPDRPDLTEGQLYTLIVTGRLQLGANTGGSSGASGQAASLVGGLVAAQLQKTLAKRLPLDVLTLQAGEGLTGSRLEAGTYLTSKLYAGYVGRVGANPALLQNRNALHIEYRLSRRWGFDGEYGDAGTGTADLLWTKHY